MGEDIVEWPSQSECCGEEREGRSSSLTSHVRRRGGRLKVWPMCLSAKSRSKAAEVDGCPGTQLDHFREGRWVFVCLQALSTVVSRNRRWVAQWLPYGIIQIMDSGGGRCRRTAVSFQRHYAR